MLKLSAMMMRYHQMLRQTFQTLHSWMSKERCLLGWFSFFLTFFFKIVYQGFPNSATGGTLSCRVQLQSQLNTLQSTVSLFGHVVTKICWTLAPGTYSTSHRCCMSHAKTSTAAVIRVYDECWLELPNSYLPYSVLVAKDHSSVKPGIIPKLHLSSVLVAGVLQNTILERQASVVWLQ